MLEHQTKLARYVRRFVGDRETALDLVQDVFLAAYRTLAGGFERPLTAGWLCQGRDEPRCSTSQLRSAGARSAEAAQTPDIGCAPFRSDELSAISLDLQRALNLLGARRR